MTEHATTTAMPDAVRNGLAATNLVKSAWLAYCCCSIVRLGVAEAMSPQPRTAAAVAADTALDTDTLHRVLRALSTTVLVEEIRPGEFALTPTGVMLRADTPGSVANQVSVIGDDVLYLFAELDRSLRSGAPTFDEVHGQPFYAYLADHPERNQQITARLSRSRHVPASIASADLRGVRTVVDLGGGNGALIARLLADRPELLGTLIELREPAREAGALLAEDGVADRCTVVDGDFFDVPIPAADAYVLARVLRNWPDERAKVLLERIRAACRPGSRLLVVDKAIPDGVGPHPAKVDDLLMLVLVRGRVRTEREFTTLLERSGFRFVELRTAPDPGEEALIEAIAS